MIAKPYQILMLAVLGIVFFALHLAYFPVGADYYFSFRPATLAWLNGQQLYAPPDYVYGAFNAPWLFVLLAPLSWLGYKGMLSGLALLTIAGIIGSWKVFARSLTGYARPISLAFVLLNLHVFDLLFRGQIDVFVLLGITLLYEGMQRDNPEVVGLGWVLSVIRPTGNVLLLIWSALEVLRRRYFPRALIIPVLTLLASFILFDPGWIGRYYAMVRGGDPPDPGPWLVTLWHAAEYLKLPPLVPLVVAVTVILITIAAVLRYQPSLRIMFALLPAASLIVIPYALSYHYLVLLVVAIPLLLAFRLWLALPLYLLSLTPLLRLVFGVETAWIDIIFPFTIWLLLLYMAKQGSAAGDPTPLAAETSPASS